MIAAIALAATLGFNAHSVLSISIRWSWFGLGNPRLAHTVITRTPTGFARTDGSVVSASDVDTFLEAVADPGHLPVTLDDLGVTREYLQSHLRESETGCVPAKDARGKTAFEAKYFDVGAMTKIYTSPLADSRGLTDSYPNLDVHIVTTSEGITLTSTSNNPHMFPIAISGSRQGLNYNVRLMPALATLLGDTDLQKSNYFGNDDAGNILGNWLTYACFAASQAVSHL